MSWSNRYIIYQFVVRAAVGALLPVCCSNIAIARTHSTEGIQAWVSEIKILLDSPDTGALSNGKKLVELIYIAQEHDERQTALQAHVEVIQARAKAGRSWPDPELRLGYEEEDRDDTVKRRRAGLRFRLPDRADRRLLEKISKVDIDWTHERIMLLKHDTALQVKRLFAEGVFAHMRLQAGIFRLDELFEQENQLSTLKESGQANLVEEARVVLEQVKLFRSLREEVNTLNQSKNGLVNLGIDFGQAEEAIVNGNWTQLVAKQFSSAESLVNLALRNSEDTLDYTREKAMLAIHLKEVKRRWLPSPSFFQIEWGDRQERGQFGRENEWEATAGFELDLFDDHEEELLLSLQRETELDRGLEIQAVTEKVKKELSNVLSMVQSYDQYESISRSAISSVKQTLQEITEAGQNLTSLWDIHEELFELETELLELQWDLVESQSVFEEAVGQTFSTGN